MNTLNQPHVTQLSEQQQRMIFSAPAPLVDNMWLHVNTSFVSQGQISGIARLAFSEANGLEGEQNIRSAVSMSVGHLVMLKNLIDTTLQQVADAAAKAGGTPPPIVSRTLN